MQDKKLENSTSNEQTQQITVIKSQDFIKINRGTTFNSRDKRTLTLFSNGQLKYYKPGASIEKGTIDIVNNCNSIE